MPASDAMKAISASIVVLAGAMIYTFSNEPEEAQVYGIIGMLIGAGIWLFYLRRGD